MLEELKKTNFVDDCYGPHINYICVNSGLTLTKNNCDRWKPVCLQVFRDVDENEVILVEEESHIMNNINSLISYDLRCDCGNINCYAIRRFGGYKICLEIYISLVRYYSNLYLFKFGEYGVCGYSEENRELYIKNKNNMDTYKFNSLYNELRACDDEKFVMFQSVNNLDNINDIKFDYCCLDYNKCGKYNKKLQLSIINNKYYCDGCYNNILLYINNFVLKVFYIKELLKRDSLFSDDIYFLILKLIQRILDNLYLEDREYTYKENPYEEI